MVQKKLLPFIRNGRSFFPWADRAGAAPVGGGRDYCHIFCCFDLFRAGLCYINYNVVKFTRECAIMIRDCDIQLNKKWHLAKALAASGAIVPLALSFPMDAVQAVAVDPIASSTAIDQKIAEELQAQWNGSLEVGKSLVIDLEDVFEDAEQRLFTVINHNPKVVDVKIDSNMLRISGRMTGSTSVDFIAHLEDGGQGSGLDSTYQERFRLFVDPNLDLIDADGQGMAIDDIVRYMNGDASQTIRREDVHHLLHHLSPSVTLPNRVPESADTYAQFDISLDQTLTVELNDYFFDPDGDELFFTAEYVEMGSHHVVEVSLEEGSKLNATILAPDTLPGQVVVKASDREDFESYAEKIFYIEYIEGNASPVVMQPIMDQTAYTGQSFTFDVSSQTFHDPDVDDVLTYSAMLEDGQALPSWLTFDAGKLQFCGTPSLADVGTYSIRVIATDGAGASASTTFQLTVEVGDVAVASHYDTMTFRLYKGQTLFLELSEVFYDAAGGSYAFTSDPIEPDLAYEASLNNDDGSFVISFTGQEEMTFTHTFKATDDQGEATTTINVNYVPVWSSEVSLYGSFSMQDKLFEHFAPYYLDEQMLLVPGISFYETPGWATQDVDDPDLWTVEPGYKAIIDSLDFRAAHGDLFWIYHVTPVQVGTPVSIIPSAVEKLWMIPTYPLEASYGSIYLKPYSETYEGMVFEHEGIFHDPDGWIDYYVIEDRESFPSGFSLYAYLIDTDSEESTTSPFQADALVIHMHYTLEPQPITIVAYHAGEDEESAEDDVEVGRYTIEFELNAPPSFYIDDWILMTPDENGNYMRTLDLSEWVEDEDLSTVLYQLYVNDAPGTITITPNTILEKPVDNPVITITGTSPGYAFIDLLMFDSYGFQGYGYLDFLFADVAVHLGPEESTTIPLLELLPEGAEQVSFALDPYFEPEYSVKGLDDYGFIGESFFAVAKPGNYEELTTVFPIVYSYELGGQTIEGKLYIVMTAGEN